MSSWLRGLESSIATRLFRLVFALYVLVAIGITVSQMIIEFQHQKQSILNDLSGPIRQAFEKSITMSLWELDAEALKSDLSGILNLPSVVGVSIHDAEGACVAAGGIIQVNNDKWGLVEKRVNLIGFNPYSPAGESSEIDEHGMFEHTFPLVHSAPGGDSAIGVVKLYSNNLVVLRRVKLQFTLLVVSAVIKTVVLWLLFLYFANAILRKPLADLTQATKSINFDNLATASVSVIPKGRNELNKLQETFNQMLARLSQSWDAQKDAEQKIRDAFETLSMAETIAGLGNWHWDPGKNSVHWSESMCRIHGINSTQLSHSLDDFTRWVHIDDAELLGRYIEKLRQGKCPQGPIQYRIVTPQGALVWVELTGQPSVGDKVGPETVMGTIQNIAYRKELEMQLLQSQKMDALGTLAGGIAHDFNNLLSPILGYAQLLKNRSRFDDMELRFITIIENSAQRSKALVEQILDISRPSTERTETVDLTGLVREVLLVIRASITKDITIIEEIDSGIPPLSVNTSQIYQVILNLCTNSIQAMSDGGTLLVRLQVAEGDQAVPQQEQTVKAFVCLTVKDSGCGMSESTLKKLYDPFFTTKDKGAHRGVGLGLSIVSNIIKRHEGHIEVESELGVGTQFRVWLPVTSLGEVSTASLRDISASVAKKHILFVDDEESLCQLAADLLESLGHRVSSFTSPHSALSALKKYPERYDAIMTDYSMPELNGENFIKEIRKFNHSIPIILVTGYSNMTTNVTLQGFGCNAVIAKPYSLDQLQKVLSQLLADAS